MNISAKPDVLKEEAFDSNWTTLWKIDQELKREFLQLSIFIVIRIAISTVFEPLENDGLIPYYYNENQKLTQNKTL